MNVFAEYITKNYASIATRAIEHLELVSVSLGIAIPLGVIIGVVLSRDALNRVRQPAVFVLGLGQAIPSLAILAFAVASWGVGFLPAVAAIAAYSLFPIVHNTVTGIRSLP